MIKGIPVILHQRILTGTDPLGDPVFSTRKLTVDDVLVSPASPEEIVNGQTVYGKKAVYTLAIPKGDDHDWQDAQIEFFGQIWQAYGPVIRGIEENLPLRWNKKVMVTAYGNAAY